MSKTIMVVDDSGSFRTVVKLALMKAGYEMKEVHNANDKGPIADRPLAKLFAG